MSRATEYGATKKEKPHPSLYTIPAQAAVLGGKGKSGALVFGVHRTCFGELDLPQREVS